MNANDMQVNGDHYRPGAKLQHWDLADRYLGYLDGYGSKYLMRWRKSPTPLSDIQKSIHIFTKLLERVLQEGRWPRRNNDGSFGVPPGVLRDFHNENKIEDTVDKLILSSMFTWQNSKDLQSIITLLQGLLPEATNLQRTRDGVAQDAPRADNATGRFGKLRAEDARVRADKTGQDNVRGYVHSEEDDGR